VRTQRTKILNAESSPLIKENLPEGQSFTARERREDATSGEAAVTKGAKRRKNLA
jgi:hypothetical protein